MKLNHLAAHDARAVRQSIITGLSEVRRKASGRSTFDYKAVVYEVALALLNSTDSAQIATHWDTFQQSYDATTPGITDESPDNRKLLGAIWGLVGEGILLPRQTHRAPENQPIRIDRVTITDRGDRVLKGANEHPLHPGFIPRFKSRYPGINDEVVARMEDAVECAEKSLLRASVVMAGLVPNVNYISPSATITLPHRSACLTAVS
jgi:hypothetical protein